MRIMYDIIQPHAEKHNSAGKLNDKEGEETRVPSQKALQWAPVNALY